MILPVAHPGQQAVNVVVDLLELLSDRNSRAAI